MIAFHRPTASAPAGMAGYSEPRRVLLVEDQDLLRWMAGEILAEEGYAVTEAADAATAVLLLSQHSFDLLVTDLDLGPGPDGYELARAARLVQPDLAIVYASGRARLQADSCAPGSRFVAKPYAPAELLGAAATTLDNRSGSHTPRFG